MSLLFADQYHLVILAHTFDARHVHYKLIHANPAHNRGALSPNQDVAPVRKNAMVAIAIAHRNQRHRCRARGDIGASITDTGIGGQRSQPRDVTFQSERRFEGSSGLDVGCGIGLPDLLLAEAVGPEGHVTGIDISPEFISRAVETASGAGLSERLTFRVGDAKAIPFDDDTFDWVWSGDCVGYYMSSQDASIRELARVVRSGGTVAIMAWSSEQLLPGYPELEARLDATRQGIAPFTGSMKPEQHLLRSLGWFRGAGLSDCRVRTIAGDVQAPLDAVMREAMTELFDMRWGSERSGVTEDEWELYRRLCTPGSADFILDLPDYYAFFTYSLFSGRVP